MVAQMYIGTKNCKNILVKLLNYWLKRKAKWILDENLERQKFQ